MALTMLAPHLEIRDFWHGCIGIQSQSAASRKASYFASVTYGLCIVVRRRNSRSIAILSAGRVVGHHFVIAVWRTKEAECEPIMKYLLGAFFLISALALRGLAQNSEQAEKPTQSPDGKWEYRLLEPEDDKSDQPPAIVKTDTDDVVVKLPEDAANSFVGAANVVWSPDSKRFAFNYRAGSRYVTTELYEMRGGKWQRLRSPQKEASRTLERAKTAEIREAKLPADIYQRRIWDTFRVIEWPDARTALLYAYSIRAVPVKEDTADIDAYYVFTLKFDGNGRWRIVNAKKLPAEEREKIPPMEGE